MLKKLPELIAEARLHVQCLSAAEAVQKRQGMDSVLIDVREPGEYAEKAANGAINIPCGVLEPKMLELYPDAEKAIFIHCASGGRATLAAEQLQRLGYNNVWAITCKVDDVITAHQDLT
ncbi:rhodanese-like domain-containing protein [Thalassotalea maritima]|uniref:rhodanese-like domain-containing protein n=1 Tax=Thalassotalea maritima TaxID=3242416 RepID=UPI0035290377